jgi:hypothetical protein
VRRTAGNPGGAQSAIERGLELSTEGGALTFELVLRTEAALTALAAGNHELAAAHVARCRQVMASGEDFHGHVAHVALADSLTAAAHAISESAQRSFTQAVDVLRRYELPWEKAQAHHLWAKALLRAGQRSRANQHFEAAIKIYRRHGAGAAWFDLIESGRRPASTGGLPGLVPTRSSGGARGLGQNSRGSSNSETEDRAEALFQHEGDYWTVEFRGAILRLRSTKGLNYISYLLSHPGQSVLAVNLARYGERDSQSGKSRRAGSRSGQGENPAQPARSGERARVMVTKGTRAAIVKIRRADQSLGRHLATRIRTGYSCIYEPDPDDRISCRVDQGSPE